MKLRAIGIGHEGLAMASSSDASTRTEIITVAIQRLTGGHPNALERVVSLGDAVWDVRAAAELDVPFVGIGSGVRAERLRAAGAAFVLEDLSDTARLCAALESATPPGGR
jgi:phosphoglycolate phosphatase-like HAD superfamily hydrolase